MCPLLGSLLITKLVFEELIEILEAISKIDFEWLQLGKIKVIQTSEWEYNWIINIEK